MEIVLDASAMLAYLRDEAGADIVTPLLADEEQTCYAHAMNVCEVYYDFLRQADRAVASASVRALLDTGLDIREDMDAEFWMAVGQYKVKYRISLADCCGLALANRLQADFITADHHEMDSLVNNGICQIQFIR